MGTQMVPFRMAEAGVEWCDVMARNHQITRSDVIRAALMYAKESESDARFSAYIRRAIAKGRITPLAADADA